MIFERAAGLTRAPWWPYLLLTAGMFLFASDVIAGRLAAGLDVPPFGLSFWRTLGGALVLTPFVAREIWLMRHVLLARWKFFCALGLSISIFGSAAIYAGLARTTALNGGVVTTSQTALTVFLGWVLFRDRISPRQGVGLVVAALGVLAIVCGGDIDALLALRPNVGDLLVFVGVSGYAFYVVVLRRAPAGVSVFGMLCVTSWLGAAFNLPVYLWGEMHGRPMVYSGEVIAMIVWISVFVSVGAIGCLTAGAIRVGAYVAGIFNYVRTLFVAGLAIVVLGEAVALYQVAGVALIVAGIALMMGRRRAPAAAAPPPAKP